MDSIKLLEKIVDKKNVLLTDRGNSSILLALKLAKQIGKKRILIQDQGGWITYKQFAKRLKLEVEEIKTDYGLVAIKEIEENIGKDCAILLNSMPAYSYMIENIDALYEMCKRRDALLINDVSGSIGDEIGKYGDIILGSFGHWKPIELGKGGFLATDNDHFF